VLAAQLAHKLWHDHIVAATADMPDHVHDHHLRTVHAHIDIDDPDGTLACSAGGAKALAGGW